MLRTTLLGLAFSLLACGNALWSTESWIDEESPAATEPLTNHSGGGVSVAAVWDVSYIEDPELNRCLREPCRDWEYDAIWEHVLIRHMTQNLETLSLDLDHYTLRLPDAPPPEALVGEFIFEDDYRTQRVGWRARARIVLYEDVDGDGELTLPENLAQQPTLDKILASSLDTIEYRDGWIRPNDYRPTLQEGYNLLGRRSDYHEAYAVLKQQHAECVAAEGMEPSWNEAAPSADYTHSALCLAPCGNAACQAEYQAGLEAIDYLSGLLHLQAGETLRVKLHSEANLRTSRICHSKSSAAGWIPGSDTLAPDTLEAFCFEGGLAMWWREVVPADRSILCFDERDPELWHFRRYPRDKLPTNWPCEVTAPANG